MTDTPFNLILTVQDIESARPVSITDVLVGQGKPAFTIGSHEKSSLRIADPEVASAHAVITLRDGEYWIAPRLSQHSVIIDNVPLKRPVRLTGETIVKLGGYTLRVSSQPTPELAASNETSALTRDYLPRTAIESPSAATGQVYFPKQPTQQRSNRTLMIAGLLVIALVAFGGYMLYTRVIQPGMEQEVVVANPFAFDDGNVTILMFDATWCGARCINQKTILESVAEQFRGDVYINYADVDSPGNAFLLTEHQVTRLPFVVILDDNGERRAVFSDSVEEATLYQAVSRALRLSNGAV